MYGRRLTSVGESERRRGWDAMLNATFLRVEATPARRMWEACSVKGVSFVRGMRVS